MSNPLFNALGGGMPQGNGPMQMMQQFMQFKQNYKGNPKEEVQKMLQSGKISQQQLNQVQQMAGQFQNLLKGMNKAIIHQLPSPPNMLSLFLPFPVAAAISAML